MSEPEFGVGVHEQADKTRRLVRILGGGETRVKVRPHFSRRLLRRLFLLAPAAQALPVWPAAPALPASPPAQSAVRPPMRARRPRRLRRSLRVRKRTSRETSFLKPSARYSGRQKYRRGDGANPLSLPRLVALLRLVDDVDAPLATHEAVVAVAIAQRFQRITDFHVRHQRFSPAGGHGGLNERGSYAPNRRADQEHGPALYRRAAGGWAPPALSRPRPAGRRLGSAGASWPQ